MGSRPGRGCWSVEQLRQGPQPTCGEPGAGAAPTVVLKQYKRPSCCSLTVLCPGCQLCPPQPEGGSGPEGHMVPLGLVQFPEKGSLRAICSLEAGGTGACILRGDLARTSWHSPQRQQEAMRMPGAKDVSQRADRARNSVVVLHTNKPCFEGKGRKHKRY